MSTTAAQLNRRFPKIELSYETISHKKVPITHPTLALAIPHGKKYYLWFTYAYPAKDICYLVSLDKDRKPIQFDVCNIPIPQKYCLGTVVYGTMVEPVSDASSDTIFVVEDVYQFRGIPLHQLGFGDRVGFLRDFMKGIANLSADVAHISTMGSGPKQHIAIPVMWKMNIGEIAEPVIPKQHIDAIGYLPHHIQYRELDRISPYLNTPMPKKGTSAPVYIASAETAKKITASSILQPLPAFDYTRPQYKYSTVFNVMADPQLDLYHLYAYGGETNPVYCGLASIQTYNASVFMNKIFRRIRENDNLDLAEESEDEDDFENIDSNKYVYLDKIVAMSCAFNFKLKKWMPVKLADPQDKIVHINKLVPERTQPHPQTIMPKLAHKYAAVNLSKKNYRQPVGVN